MGNQIRRRLGGAASRPEPSSEGRHYAVAGRKARLGLPRKPRRRPIARSEVTPQRSQIADARVGASMYKVGIDVGGTFTDFVVQEDDGRMSQGKVPSIPGDEARAVLNALELAAGALGRSLSEFLPHVAVINFGTTVATNAMLQHRGVPTAMLTTRGFRDILELRRGYKEVLFDIRLPP